MPDILVTIPKTKWSEWIIEGDLPGDAPSGEEYAYSIWGAPPTIKPGERVYVCAFGKLRGYAPLTALERYGGNEWLLIRAGGAVACTIAEPIVGFRGWRYVWWDREDEMPFPDWRNPDGAAVELPLFAGAA